MPAYGPASSFSVASSFITLTMRRPWRWPISKSVGSWPGVTFTAPVPNSISIASSASTGISRWITGSITVRPIQLV